MACAVGRALLPCRHREEARRARSNLGAIGGALHCPSAAIVRRCAEAEVMTEIIFIVEEAPEGGYSAHALGSAIFTEADSLEGLQANIRDAVRCHFEEGAAPKVIRLHFVREQVIGL